MGGMTSHDPAAPTVVGGFDAAGKAFVLAAFAAAGAVLGFVLPWLARWALGLPWVPFQGPLELLSSFDDPWLVWGRPLIGAALGLAVGLWIVLQSAVVEITPEAIQVSRYGSVERVIPRETVGGIHRKGTKTVIEAKEGRVLFDDDIEGDKARIRQAFVAHGYPWEGGPA